MDFYKLIESLEDEYAIQRDQQWRGLKGVMRKLTPKDRKKISKEIEREFGPNLTSSVDVPSFPKKKPAKKERRIVNGIDLGDF